MPEIKTTKTIEYPVNEFKKLVANKCFEGKNVSITFRIQSVSRDIMDRMTPVPEVISVIVVEEIDYDNP